MLLAMNSTPPFDVQLDKVHLRDPQLLQHIIGPFHFDAHGYRRGIDLRLAQAIAPILASFHQEQIRFPSLFAERTGLNVDILAAVHS